MRGDYACEMGRPRCGDDYFESPRFRAGSKFSCERWRAMRGHNSALMRTQSRQRLSRVAHYFPIGFAAITTATSGDDDAETRGVGIGDVSSGRPVFVRPGVLHLLLRVPVSPRPFLFPWAREYPRWPSRCRGFRLNTVVTRGADALQQRYDLIVVDRGAGGRKAAAPMI